MIAPDDRVLQQAAEWFAALHADEPDALERERWQAWLDADPAHAEAWRRVEAMSQRFERLPELAGRQAAMRALRVPARPGRRRLLRSVAVLGATGLTGWLVGRDEGPLPWRADYRTGTGERRELALADGSRLWLNSGSAVCVAFDARQRGLRLLKGELLIETARDVRPLVVHAQEAALHARGTRFSVRRDERGCHLAVYAGAVEARPVLPVPPVLVTAGQGLRIDASGQVEAQLPRRGQESWSRGLLVADGMRLADFIAELARHQPGYLGCAPEVAELRLVGSFPLDDAEQIYVALERALPVRVSRSLPWWRRVEAA